MNKTTSVESAPRSRLTSVPFSVWITATQGKKKKRGRDLCVFSKWLPSARRVGVQHDRSVGLIDQAFILWQTLSTPHLEMTDLNKSDKSPLLGRAELSDRSVWTPKRNFSETRLEPKNTVLLRVLHRNRSALWVFSTALLSFHSSVGWSVLITFLGKISDASLVLTVIFLSTTAAVRSEAVSPAWIRARGLSGGSVLCPGAGGPLFCQAVLHARRVLVWSEHGRPVPVPPGERLRQRHIHIHEGRHAEGEVQRLKTCVCVCMCMGY